jgi:hypothetical protein
MLYYHKAEFALATLPELRGLWMNECDDPHMLSAMGNITLIEATRRLANDNRAFVAWYHDKPAAFGWSASGKAKIGELNHEMILPVSHRYLWNFRTLIDFRGLGIYPRLLQYILDKESENAEWFWIMHAPENAASERGILKAGFRFAANVSLRKGTDAIFRMGDDESSDLEDVVRILGFSPSKDEQATCWTCSSPFLAHKKETCCCAQDSVACNSEVFL